MTIKLWQELISKMDDRSLQDHEISLHNLNSWLGFDQEFKDQGLKTIQMIIRSELDRRQIAWGSVHISLNKGYNENHDHCKKQIAELQEKLAEADAMIDKLSDTVERKEKEAKVNAIDHSEKLHRRNLQIADLKKELIEQMGLSWMTISDLFFNSEEANDIEIGEYFDSDETKQNVSEAVKNWCEMYPEIGNHIDQSKLAKDYINRV